DGRRGESRRRRARRRGGNARCARPRFRGGAARQAKRLQDRAREAHGDSCGSGRGRSRMSIGAAIDRLDGTEKVTGRARYTADIPMKGVLYAVMVCSTRVHARIEEIDVEAALAAPGVVEVFTHMNAPRFHEVSGLPLGQDLLPLQGDLVLYEGQPIALVVARSLETAVEAARRAKVVYRELPFETDFSTGVERGEARPIFFWEPDSHVGDVAAAWQDADVRVAQSYRTADRHHCTMEPSATLAVWDGV